MVWPFQKDVLSSVSLAPCLDAVSFGFLNSADSSTYLDTAPLPWMYHWYGPAWFDHDHLARSLADPMSLTRPSQRIAARATDAAAAGTKRESLIVCGTRTER